MPKAALEAYSLLYEIKQKNPALDLREGVFYQGIPDFSIRVNKKYSDGQTIGDVIIYDHRDGGGNKNVTIADSGKMYTILNDRYLKLELFNGHTFQEGSSAGTRNTIDPLTRSEFSKSQLILDLSSFALGDTDKRLFQTNRIMRNLTEIRVDVDSIDRDMNDERLAVHELWDGAFFYNLKHDSLDLPEYLQQHVEYRDSVERIREIASLESIETTDSMKVAQRDSLVVEKDDVIKKDGLVLKDRKNLRGKYMNANWWFEGEKPDSVPDEAAVKRLLLGDSLSLSNVQSALTLARQAKQRMFANQARISALESERIIFKIQWHKILSNSFACIMMFLIGAPLGSIIKRGGLGIPVLLSILFFIIFYVISIGGEKWARTGVISPFLGVWMANLVLFPVGLLFLRQARLDARLFDSDFYSVQIEKVKKWYLRHFKSKKQITA